LNGVGKIMIVSSDDTPADDAVTSSTSLALNPKDNYGSNKDSLSDDTEGEQSLSPRPNACLVFFNLHSSLATVSLFLLAISQVLPSPINLPVFLSLLMKVYLFFGCLCCVLIEVEFSQWFLDLMPIMRNWVFRGFSYVFLGLVGTQEGTLTIRDYKSDGAFDDVLSSVGANLASFLLWISSLALVLSGILYMIMGLFMLRGLRDKHEKDYAKKIALYEEHRTMIV